MTLVGFVVFSVCLVCVFGTVFQISWVCFFLIWVFDLDLFNLVGFGVLVGLLVCELACCLLGFACFVYGCFAFVVVCLRVVFVCDLTVLWCCFGLLLDSVLLVLVVVRCFGLCFACCVVWILVIRVRLLFVDCCLLCGCVLRLWICDFYVLFCWCFGFCGWFCCYFDVFFVLFEFWLVLGFNSVVLYCFLCYESFVIVYFVYCFGLHVLFSFVGLLYNLLFCCYVALCLFDCFGVSSACLLCLRFDCL